MIQTSRYARKPFYVDAVQVTDANFDEVAQWCMGDVRQQDRPGGQPEKYVKVRVNYPMTDRQTMAFVGDWILYAGSGYKVYTPKAFDKAFDLVVDETKITEPPVAPIAVSDTGVPTPPTSKVEEEDDVNEYEDAEARG